MIPKLPYQFVLADYKKLDKPGEPICAHRKTRCTEPVVYKFVWQARPISGKALTTVRRRVEFYCDTHAEEAMGEFRTRRKPA